MNKVEKLLNEHLDGNYLAGDKEILIEDIEYLIHEAVTMSNCSYPRVRPDTNSCAAWVINWLKGEK